MTQQTSWQSLLNEELCRRKTKNPAYSLRSFASSLKLSPAMLSLILNGKRKPSHTTADVISEQLGLSQWERDKLEPEKKTARSIKRELSNDEFKMIADWYHYAILSLADVKGNRLDAKWISERLGISTKQAHAATERLIKHGHIERRGHGFKQVSRNLNTTKDIPSAAIRMFHRQHLDNAANSLDRDPVDQRYFGSLTTAIDEDDLPFVKEAIRKFKSELSSHFAKKTELRNRVYHLAIQFFPLNNK